MTKSVFFLFLTLTLLEVLSAQDYKQEFERLWKTGEFEKQGQALFNLGNTNDAKAAKLLFDSLKIVESLQLAHEQKINKKASEADKYEDGDGNKVPLIVELIKLRDQMAEYDFIIDKAAAGIALFSDPQAVKIMVSEAPKSKSITIKMAIMKALGKINNKEAIDLLIKSLKDKAAPVRQIAAESLKEKTPPEAFEPLLALISDKVWQVRSAAVETLAKYNDPKCIKPLIDQLKDEKGRVTDDIEKTLKALTGETHEGNYHAWVARYAKEKENWMQGIKKETPKEVEIQTINHPLRGSKKYYEEVASQREKAEGKPKDGGTVVFVPSGQKIIYILDYSDSMNKEAPQSLIKSETVIVGESKTMTKIEVLRKKMAKELPKLRPHQFFTIIFYNHKIEWWKKELVPGTPENINKAITAITTTPAAGSTNTYGALEYAFNMSGRGNFDKAYETSFDTIVLVSDGMPTGEYQPQRNTDQNPNLRQESVVRFLDAVLKLNQLRRIKINTIGVPPETMDDVLGGLAADTGGTYHYWEIKD